MLESRDGRTISVRRVARKDVDSVVRLWQAIADERKFVVTEHVSPERRKRWVRSITDGGVLWELAEVDGELAGTLTLSRYGNLAKTKHIRELEIGIAKPFRGIGVGTALMDCAIRWADRRKVKKVILSVFSTNGRALSLYKKFGFLREGTRKKQYLIDGEYVDEVMMGRFVQ